ncbi:DUF262 domain-containing protein [Curtobacterium sp. MCBD17_035]|uniref:DUF262 domain-containing protein n=1 Tax=Curtobacterium sp. MCBD17_035 TaxID=2175673 RepID=UPI000DA8000D|nr:DUF262 domain-containing protein [Curtobacterium sp. MCBD17_035]WIB66743.1 DUF262 domain-containing protein [Curtobacterium sp. MCBD17_035]
MQHRSRDFSVTELLRLARSGLLALPEFQRPFVWEPGRVIELLDSVLNGWPVGSLLVLEGPQPFRIRPIDGAPEVYEDEVELYLLDGQQRVTALYHALTGTSETVYFADFNDTTEDGDPSLKWAPRKSFSFEAAVSRRVAFESLLDPAKFDAAIQVVDARMSAWMLETRQVFTDEDNRASYTLPAIVMEQAISLEALTRIFETLNRTGVRLNSFDLMVAVLFPSGFNLRDEWEFAKANSELLERFEVNGLEVLKLVALWQRDIDAKTKSRPASRRVTGVRQRDVLNIPPDSVSQMWNRAVSSYASALDFMSSEFGVRPGGVPTDAMVLGVAYFLDAGVSRAAITRWYWSSVALQTYAQGANTQVLTDTRDGEPLAPSAEVVVPALGAALLDESRRNKILRLGLRGLAVLHEDRDPVTDEPLTESVVEVSSTALGRGQALTDGDVPVAGLVFIGKESVRLIRKGRTLGQAPSEILHEGALRSQGFPRGIYSLGDDDDVQERANLLAERLLARLS